MALLLPAVCMSGAGFVVEESDTGRRLSGPAPLPTPTRTQARLAGAPAPRGLPGRRHYWKSGSMPPNPSDSPRPSEAVDPQGVARWDARAAKRRRQTEALLKSQGKKP